MCLVRLNKRSSVSSNLQIPRELVVSLPQGPITHSRIAQNIDGSWSIDPVATQFPQITTNVRRRKNLQAREGNREGNTMYNITDVDDEAISSEEEPRPRSYRGKKRKLDDAGFSPEDEHLESENQETEHRDPPRQATAKRPKTQSAIAKRNAVNKSLANVQQDKPEPYGKPQVWAAKRQQLCEVLPYYRAYQSAAYTSGGLVHSFMCDKEVGIRDKFDDEILIARV